MDIPEKTILKSGEIADNTAYINLHRIGGLVKYSPIIDKGETPHFLNKNIVKLEPHPMLNYFLYYEDTSRKLRYFYNTQTSELSLSGRMSDTEYRELIRIYKMNLSAQKAIGQLYYVSIKRQHASEVKIYNVEEKDFIKKNKTEFTYQARAGSFLYHHGWMLNPINAVILGGSIFEQPLIYGALSTLTIKQIMLFLGGDSFDTYFKSLYVFYPIYYLVFLAVIFLVFKRIEYVLIAGMLLSCNVFWLTDEIIRLAPGCNPFRHVFDMIAFLGFYFYLKNLKNSYLYCSLAFCLFAVLWSKDFGIFLLFSICGTAIIQSIITRNLSFIKLVILIAVCLLSLGCYMLPLGKNPNLVYMLIGLGTPGTSRYLTIITLLSLGALNLIYVKLIKTKEPMYFLSLSLFFYGQLLLVYFLWYPSIHHFLVSTIPFIFVFLTMLFMYEKSYKKRLNLQVGCCYLLLLLYVPSVLIFYYGRIDLSRIFSTHVVYDWDIEHAGFKSTIDPALFKDSIKLIQAYEGNDYMYLISKYDAILPMIAHKYNALHSASVFADLISYDDICRFFNLIKNNSPIYIFIDTDIARSYIGDVFDPNDPLAKKDLYQQSSSRASMMMNSKQLYSKLLALYEPIDKGALITVYRRKQV